MAGLAGQGPHYHSHFPVGNRIGDLPTDGLDAAPPALRLRHISLVHHLGFLCPVALVLAGAPDPVGVAGHHRPASGELGGVCDGSCGQLVELPLSPGYHRGGHPVAPPVGLSRSRLSLHPLCCGSWAHLFRGYSFLLADAPEQQFSAGHCPDQLLCLFRGGLSRGPAFLEAAPGRREAEVHERSPRQPAGPARKHHPLDQRRSDHHGP